jgi:hypothetical protein
MEVMDDTSLYRKVSINSTGEATGTGPVSGVPVHRGTVHCRTPPKTPVRGGRICWTPQKPRGGLSVVVSFVPCSEKPGPGWSPLWPTGRPGPGTGDRSVTGFWFFVKIRSVTMPDSEFEKDGWEEGSRDEQQNTEGDDDDSNMERRGGQARDGRLQETSRRVTDYWSSWSVFC